MMPSAYFIRDGKTNPWTGGGRSMYPPPSSFKTLLEKD